MKKKLQRGLKKIVSWLLSLVLISGFFSLAVPINSVYAATPSWTDTYTSAPVNVTSMLEADGTLYAGVMGNNGVWAYSNGVWSPVSGSPTSVISLLYKDNILYTGGDGVSCYSNGSWTTLGVPSNNVYSLLDVGGILYAGTLDGLYTYNDVTLSWSPMSSSPLGIRSLLYENGTLYAGTDEGVFSYSGGSWASISGLTFVQSLQYVNDTLYAGSIDGVYYLSSGTWIKTNGSPASANMLAKINGILYAGTYYGVFTYNDTTSSWSRMNGSPNNTFYLLDVNGTIYAGTLYTTWHYQDGSWTPVAPGIINSLQLAGSMLYAGTADAVWSYSNGTWTLLYSEPDWGVTSILYTNGTLYVWTLNNGVYSYSNGVWTQTNDAPDYVGPVTELTAGGIIYKAKQNGLSHERNYLNEIQVSGTPSGVNSLQYGDGSLYVGANGLYIYTVPFAPIITTISLPYGRVGTPYSVTLDATGDTPFSWNINVVSPPNGLSLSPDGVLSGTPTTAVIKPVGIRVTSEWGTLTRNFYITINASSGAVIDTQPVNCTAPSGSTATFTVAAHSDDGGQLSYQWQFSITNGFFWSNVPGAGGDTASYTTGILTTADSGTLYRCVVTGSGGLVASNPATLTVSAMPAFVPVTGITGVPTTATAGTPLSLSGTVTPANATNKTIVWSVQDAGTTGANISGNTLSATAAGTVTVRATIINGLTASTNYTQDFIITVSATPVTTYIVTFNSSGTVYATKTANAGQSIGSAAWPADPTRSSYIFGGWFTGENGAGNQFTSATLVNAATTVYAKWTYNSGGGSSGDGSGSGGGSSSGGGGTASPIPTYNAGVNADNSSNSTLPVTVDKSSGNASVDVGTGNSLMSDGKTTVITVPAVPDIDTYTLGIPVPGLLTQDEQGALAFNTETGSITIPSNMLTGVSGINGSKAEITIGQGDKTSLPSDVKTAIGDRPLISLSLSIDGIQTDWNNPDAPVTVSIPFTPIAAELSNPENIVIWYIDGSGNAVSVPNGHYDPATGTMTFTTTHFSYYAVGYNKVSFNDVVDTAWYSDAVGFVSARGITAGTGNGKYSPDAKLTRGEFIVMLMRAYSIAPDENPTYNFSDAESTYYTSYLATAKRLGISAGVGNNLFAPGKEITRQEMFTLLYNALKVIGQLPGTHGRAVSEADDQPQGNSGKMLSDFTDAGQVASWAKNAMLLLVETGTIGGSGGKLNPASTTTRAEMAQVLYNLLAK